jgi:hypothetical protein
MSQKDSTGRRLRAGFSLATAVGGAVAAAALSMGMAHATPLGTLDSPYVDAQPLPDPYTVLFGDAPGGQGTDNAALDASLFASNPTGDASFQIDVSQFEAGQDHALENLINAIDPSAFAYQVGGLDVGDVGTLAGGAYLIPESTLGYLAVGLDYGLLTPTGLDFVLTPLIDILLGQG